MPRPGARRRSSCSRPRAALAPLTRRRRVWGGLPRATHQERRRAARGTRAEPTGVPGRIRYWRIAFSGVNSMSGRVALGHRRRREAEALHPLAVLRGVLGAEPVEPLRRRTRARSRRCRAGSSTARRRRRPRGGTCTRSFVAEVAHLRGVRLAHDERPAVAPEEPDRHGVREAVAADRAEPRHLLALEARERARVHVVAGSNTNGSHVTPPARR